MSSIGKAASDGCRRESRPDVLEPSRRYTCFLGVRDRSMRILPAIVVIALFAALRAPAAVAQPVAVTKTNPLKVYMHYMPWFETPETLGANQWGYRSEEHTSELQSQSKSR